MVNLIFFIHSNLGFNLLIKTHFIEEIHYCWKNKSVSVNMALVLKNQIFMSYVEKEFEVVSLLTKQVRLRI